MTDKIVIDLTNKDLNEVYTGYNDFAHNVAYLLRSLGYSSADIFGSGGMMKGGRQTQGGPNLSIKGSPAQISAFFTALNREKRYMDSYIKNGLDDPSTMKSKYELDKSVRKFEYETGLKWPFKN
jgi:hypothetical protein